MSTHADETAVETGTDANEQNNSTSARLSPDTIEEKIKANLEPLHAQISVLTEMMDKLIQVNSGREFTTASTRELRLQYELPFAEASAAFRFSPIAPLTIARCSPDTWFEKFACYPRFS